MADKAADVDGDGGLFELGEERREWNGGAAIGAFDERGDAFAQVVFSGRDEEDAVAAVGVDVDEAGGDRAVGGIDALSGGGFSEVADGCDGVAGDGDIGAKPGVAGTVDELTVDDNEVVGGWGGGLEEEE